MAIYKGNEAALKIEYPAGSGTYTTVAILTDTSISQSASPVLAGDLLQHTAAQFVADDMPLNCTADASGYLANEASHYFLQRLFDSRQAFNARIFKDATLYIAGDAKITSLSISGSHNGPAQVSLSMQLSDTVEETGYNALIESLDGVHHWPLHETSGSTAADIIGGADGTYNGSYTLDQDGLINRGKSVLFNGTDSYISIPSGMSGTNLEAGTSIVAWIKPTSGGNTNRAVCNFVSISATKPFIWRAGENDLFAGRRSFYYSQDHTDGIFPASTAKLAVITFSGSYTSPTSYKLYSNDTEYSLSSTSTGNAVLTDSNWIGRYNYGGSVYFGGLISNVSLHTRRLSASEVAQIYAYAAG
jgi:predicted secreted protein